MINSDSRLIDVSHSIEHGLITYRGLPAPLIRDYLSREDSRNIYAEGTEFQIGWIEMVANTGTYVDAPFHRYASGDDLSAMPLQKVANLPGVVVRIDPTLGRAIDLSVADTSALENRAVLVHTAWSRFWNTPEYFGSYPYLTSRSARFLVEAGAALVGIDSLNIDDDRDGRRPVHTTLLEAGVPVVEHLTNLDRLPDTDFRFFAAPAKVRGLGSFPVRAFALVP